MHPRFPGQQRQGLAGAKHERQLILGHFSCMGVRGRRVVVEKLTYFVCRLCEDVGNIELVRRAYLDAHWRDQHQAAKALRCFRRHFRGNPAADGAADNV